eukprot:6179522-Pleurochrysis_carterae.AAC.2
MGEIDIHSRPRSLAPTSCAHLQEGAMLARGYNPLRATVSWWMSCRYAIHISRLFNPLFIYIWKSPAAKHWLPDVMERRDGLLPPRVREGVPGETLQPSRKLCL